MWVDPSPTMISAFEIPKTVPNNPTHGAVAAMLARLLKPRFIF